jgi:hypothetical protein
MGLRGPEQATARRFGCAAAAPAIGEAANRQTLLWIHRGSELDPNPGRGPEANLNPFINELARKAPGPNQWIYLKMTKWPNRPLLPATRDGKGSHRFCHKWDWTRALQFVKLQGITIMIVDLNGTNRCTQDVRIASRYQGVIGEIQAATLNC